MDSMTTMAPTCKEVDDAINEAFAAVGRAHDARLRAALSGEEALHADTRLGNLAAFWALGLGADGSSITE